MIAGQDNVAFTPVVVVTFDTVFVQDRLDVTRVIEDVGNTGDGSDRAGRPFECLQSGCFCRDGCLLPLLVTADAAGRLTRHDGEKAVHAFDRIVVLIQGDEEQAPQRGYFHIGRPVGFDRDCPYDTFECIRSTKAYRGHLAAVIDRLRECLQYEELLDLAPLDSHHVASGVYILQDQPARRLLKVASRRDDRLARPHSQWARLVTFDAISNKLIGQAIDLAHLAGSVHRQQSGTLSHQKAISRNGIRVAEILLFRDPLSGSLEVRPLLRRHYGEGSFMFPASMVGGEDRHHLVVTVRDRLGVDHQRPWVQVAVIDHLTRAVGVGRPEVVKRHPTAIDVLPPFVDDPAVGKDPGCVVVLDIA